MGAIASLILPTKPTAILLWRLLLAFGHRRAAVAAVVSVALCGLGSLALLHFDAACWARWLEGTWRYATQTDLRRGCGLRAFSCAPQALG